MKQVLVVGSGPVGAVYARLLVAAGCKVTMVDSGAALSDPPGEHLANAFVFANTPNLFMDVTAAGFETYSTSTGIFGRMRSKYRRNYENPDQKFFRGMPFASAVYAVGGMSTIWTASCPDHADFELPSVLPVEEWRRLIQVADGLLAVNDTTFATSFVGKAILDRLNGQSGTTYHQLPVAASPADLPHTVRWTGSAVILGPLLDDPDTYADTFELLAEHRVEKLDVVDGKVVAAHVHNLHTNTSRVMEADTFVIAAGSFLTPRLLWQSMIRPAALGHYLHDHTQAGVSVTLRRSMLERLRKMPDNPAAADPLPIAEHAIPPMIGLAPTKKRPWHGQIHGSGKKFLYTGGTDVRKVLDMSFYGMVTPKFKNHISFSDEVMDRFGQPQITINFRWSWADVWHMIRMWFDMVSTARKLGRIKGIPIISPPGTTLHLMGTYRMGDDAQKAQSVTDTNSKVWDHENLYLGGLGLIPDANASNPTNVACAMAVRAASAIAGISPEDLASRLEAPELPTTRAVRPQASPSGR